MRSLIILIALCMTFGAHASSIRIPLTPESNTIDQSPGFAIIEKLHQPEGLNRVRIVVPKASSVLPLHSISLIIGTRDNPGVAVDLAVLLGIADCAETTFQISDKYLSEATISVHYANYNRSSAAELYEFQLMHWIKKE